LVISDLNFDFRFPLRASASSAFDFAGRRHWQRFFWERAMPQGILIFDFLCVPLRSLLPLRLALQDAGTGNDF
jgi:hypothetical protein